MADVYSTSRQLVIGTLLTVDIGLTHLPRQLRNLPHVQNQHWAIMHHPP